MFRLSKGSEYAILGLTYMADRSMEGGGVSPDASPDVSPDISIDEIAQSCDIPKAFLAKLFHTLATRRLVRSFRGREGGFVLARPASEITLLQVVEAIEGPIDQGAESEKRGGAQEVSGSNRINSSTVPSSAPPQVAESDLMKVNRGFDVPSAQKPTNVMLKPRRGESAKNGCDIYSVLRECLGNVSSTLNSYTLRDMARGAKAALEDADKTTGNAETANTVDTGAG